MKILTEADFLISNWSGGKSTQLYIFPENATVAERNFDWRISFASVESEESDFTLFEGYERILIPLAGKLEMEHQTSNGVIEQYVNELELARFSGSWPTKGKGKLTDFNVIFKPNYHPRIQIIPFLEDTEFDMEEAQKVLFLQTGTFQVNNQFIHAPALVLNKERQKSRIIVSATSRMIAIEMNLVG